MADVTYTANLDGFQISNTSFTDGQGNFFTTGGPGTSLLWGTANLRDDNFSVVDVDGDGVLEVGNDYYAFDTVTFSGYTVRGTDGQLYPLFASTTPGIFFVPVPEGSPSTLIPNPGQSEPYQASVTGTYLCFAEGTALATPSGPVSAENLKIGDLVETFEGGPVPAKWIGRQTAAPLFNVAPRLQLVRVRAGALGGGLPERDLVLTADHALLIDGLLINASALVNGSSIDWVPPKELGDRYTVYHVETEAHDVILAEGTPAETFIDYVGRQAFDNYAEYVALYGEDRTIREMPFPRISSARMLPQGVRRRVLRAPRAPLAPLALWAG